MSVKQTKFNTLNEFRKATSKGVSRAISELNGHASAAIKQSAYMHTNPDDNGSDELVPIIQAEFDLLVTAFAEAQSKLSDLIAVRSGTMTSDALITKYNVNLAEFSNELL